MSIRQGITAYATTSETSPKNEQASMAATAVSVVTTPRARRRSFRAKSNRIESGPPMGRLAPMKTNVARAGRKVGSAATTTQAKPSLWSAV